MKEYEVWLEGYRATGEHSTAHFHGKAEAETFDEACIKLLGDKLDKNGDGSYCRGSSGNYSIWCCNLFDNETDARKSCG